MEFVSPEIVCSDLKGEVFTQKGKRRGMFSGVKCYIFNTHFRMNGCMNETEDRVQGSNFGFYDASSVRWGTKYLQSDVLCVTEAY